MVQLRRDHRGRIGGAVAARAAEAARAATVAGATTYSPLPPLPPLPSLTSLPPLPPLPPLPSFPAPCRSRPVCAIFDVPSRRCVLRRCIRGLLLSCSQRSPSHGYSRATQAPRSRRSAREAAPPGAEPHAA